MTTPDVRRGVDRELAVEQANLDLLYALLDRLRERAEVDLAAVRRAPVVPTPAGRAERDAFDAWHSERLSRLRAVEDRLCFGRLDMLGDATRYIGRIGLSDDAQTQLLIDWRAPAAAAFYQATAASPQGVLRRRQLASRNRALTSLDDEVLDTDAFAEAAARREDLAVVAGEGALMSALTARRTGQMRDIVATLQAEQDRIVRAPLAGVLVVQGGPGTGKTAVALHRAAYLLYTHRDRIARSGVLVIGPSPVFLRYIEQVLPSLGETGVVLTTTGRLFPGVEATAHDSGVTARVKGDLRMAQVLRRAVRLRQRELASPVPLVLDGDRIMLRPKAVAAARGRARSTNKPHNDARTTFALHLLDDLADQLLAARRMDGEDEHTRAEAVTELRQSVDVRREINLLWMPLSPTKVLAGLYAVPARLAAAADGLLSQAEQAALARQPGSPWTIDDVALLDELAELLGDDAVASAAESAKAQRERAEALEYARGVLEMSGAGDMVTAEMLADRFAAGESAVTLAERAAEDRTWVYGHAVVDEAQELSAMQWRLLVRRVPSRSMTVVGDVAQTSSAAGADSWGEVLEQHAAGRWRVEELSINYRTPGRIMRVAAAVAEAAGVRVRPPASAREGDWDVERVRVPGSGWASAAVEAVRAHDALLPGGRFAVVVPRSGAAGLAAAIEAGLEGELASRTAVHSTDDVKGLEFDAVVVCDPAAMLADGARGANDLYVALTRPTQRLTVLHAGDLPAGF
ncbi:MAG: AAA family ATPase [Kineosporiaceae bacterium]